MDNTGRIEEAEDRNYRDTVVQDKSIVAMGNYFTLKKVIHRLCDNGIGVVGTSRFRRGGWPPAELKDGITAESSQYNDFYWMIDSGKTLIARWKDNGMVFVVSTIHKIGKIIKRLRKRPRKSTENKKNVEKIWGDNLLLQYASQH